MLGIGTVNRGGDPLLTIPGLFGYWSAERVVLTSATVETVLDISGNNIAARNLSFNTTRPNYLLNDPNFGNKPSILSSTANARLQATFDTTLQQPATWYLVMRVETNANTMFWRSNAGNFTDSAGFYWQTDNFPRLQVNDAGTAITSQKVLPGNGINYVSCCIYNAGTSSLYFNNSGTANSTAPGDGSIDANGCAVLTIGNFGSANVYSWTTMAAYSGTHDANTRKKIMMYLGSKYNIITS